MLIDQLSLDGDNFGIKTTLKPILLDTFAAISCFRNMNQQASQHPETVHSNGEKSPKGWSRLSRLLAKLVLFLLTCFVLGFLLFQIPAVQTWSLRQITNSLSNKLNTEVSVGYFRLGFFNKLQLSDVYVEDLNGDSLLYSNGLEAGLDLSPITILRHGLVINRLKLKDSQLFIRRKADELETNLNQFFAALQKKDKEPKEKSGNSFGIDLKYLELGRLKMVKADSLKNQIFTLGVEGAYVEVCEVDLASQNFEFQNVRIKGPLIQIDDYTRTALWDSISAIPVERDSSRMRFKIEGLEISEGQFALHNYRKVPVKLTPDSILDYKHMEVYDIKMEIKDFIFARDTFEGRVECFSLKDLSGFELNDWSAKQALVHPKGVELNGMQLLTPYTQLTDTLQLRYKEYAAFIDFPNDVIIDAKMNNSSIALRDIIAFAPKLNENSFFIRNRDQSVRVDGRLLGTVNNLDGRNLRLSLEDDTRVWADLNSRNLAVPGENFISLRFDALQTTVPVLRKWLPNFDVPANFDHLGRLGFLGSVDILFSDVVTTGHLTTEIGDADLDIQIIDLAAGKTKTKYSGKIDLQNFDLGVWTGNTDYGLVSLQSEVQNGIGLTAASAFAEFSANIKSFVFREYNYESAVMTGGLNAQQFDGRFNIQDDNIDFNFNGKIDLSNGAPVYDFKSSINHLNLKALNFTEDDLRLKGKVNLNLRNKKLADLAGKVILNDIGIVKNDKEVFIDSIEIVSVLHQDSIKELTLKSDVIEGQVNGSFNIEKIPLYIGKFVQEHYPMYAYYMGFTKVDSIFMPQVFTYDFEIKDSKGIQQLFVEDLSDFKNAEIHGLFSNVDSVFEGSLKMPALSLGKAKVDGLQLSFDIEGAEGNVDFEASGVAPNDKIQAAPVYLLGDLHKDTVRFSLTYDNKGEKALLNRLFLDGQLQALDSSLLRFDMDESNLKVLDETWVISDQGKVYFKEDSILIQDLNAYYKSPGSERSASLESFDKRGVNLSIVNLDFEGLNKQLNYKPLQFDGDFNVFAQTRDITKLEKIRFEVNSDSFLINEDDWGSLDVVGLMDNAKQPLVSFISLKNDTSQLILDAIYNVADIGQRPEESKGYFTADLSIKSFPMAFAEYFIGGTISDAVGSFGSKLHFSGFPEKPNVFGNVFLNSGALTLNYLKTRYTFQEETILVDNYSFDASGAKLFDVYGNDANIVGGIRHDHLKNFGFDARLSTDRFQGLNTKKGDNKLFYGHGIGAAEILFFGTFKQPDIYVQATVAEGTEIAIPISSDRQASEFGFIRFVDKDKELGENGQQDTITDLKGVSLDMDLYANNTALMKIIFDEQVGDVIEGRGYGALSISVPRGEDFKMYGDYTIENGDYLFTLYNIINKKFQVQRGGTITWTGDPFTAQIDITAQYSNVNAPVANFIQEYLVGASEGVRNQAYESTIVNLYLRLTGELLKPNVDFDIEFPNLVGELQTYANNKLRLLQLDQNELNKQVFGLIVAGQFLPNNLNLVQGNEVIFNTVGELLSNQLSLLLSQLLDEVIGENEILSGTDIDIAYSQYQSQTADLGSDQNSINRGNEVALSLKQNLFNDRFSIRVGGNLDLDGSTQATSGSRGAFVGNDVIVEYIINDERTVTLRLYQKTEPDFGGRKLEFGAGFSYRQEFNSFSEFLQSFKRDAEKRKLRKEKRIAKREGKKDSLSLDE